MELQLFQQISQKLADVSKQLAVLQDYVHIKFGVDFQEFCNSRGVVITMGSSPHMYSSVAAAAAASGSSKNKKRQRMKRKSIRPKGSLGHSVEAFGEHLDPETGILASSGRSNNGVKTESSDDDDDDEGGGEGDHENDSDEDEFQMIIDKVMGQDNEDDEGGQHGSIEDVLSDSDIDIEEGGSCSSKKFKTGLSKPHKKELKKSIGNIKTSSKKPSKSKSESEDEKSHEKSSSVRERTKGRRKDEIWNEFVNTEGSFWKCSYCNHDWKFPQVDRLRRHLLKCKGRSPEKDKF